MNPTLKSVSAAYEPVSDLGRSATMQRPFRFAFHALVLVFLILPSFHGIGNAQATDLDNILWTTRWNHDGSRFAVGGIHALWVFDSATLTRRSLLPKALGVRSDHTSSPYIAVTRVAWHPSSNLLAVSSQGRNVNGIYDISSGKRTALTATQDHFGRGVSWSPDGSFFGVYER